MLMRPLFLGAILFALTACSRPAISRTDTVDPASLKAGPVLHSLTPDQERRVRALQTTLAEVDPSTFEEWADGFKRDQHPDSEIEVWETIAAAYRSYATAHALTLEQKQDVFALLLMRSMAPEKEALASAKLKVLTPAEAREVLAAYKASPVPIRVRSTE